MTLVCTSFISRASGELIAIEIKKIAYHFVAINVALSHFSMRV